jgi:hypothetical protein
MSPNKSTAGAAARGGGGALDDDCGCWPVLCDADRSSLVFSCTMLSGSSSSAPNVEGSGIGPSMTHRFDSYFVRMKFSIFASDGLWPRASLASQYLFARVLPHFRILCSCSSVHESRSTDLTLLMCVPMPRWMPEHRMHTKTPRFQLAHRGCLFRLQSAHTLLPSSFTSALRVCVF